MPLLHIFQIIDNVISLVLVQEEDEGESSVYLSIMVLKGVELYYQNIELLTLEIVFI